MRGTTELTHNWSPSRFYDVTSLGNPPTHSQSIIATDQLLKSRSDHHHILFQNVPPAPATTRFCFCVPCNCLGPLCWHICANPWRHLCRHFSLSHRCKVSDMPFLRFPRLRWVKLIADLLPQHNNSDHIIHFSNPGCDKRTYHNACFAGLNGVTSSTEGVCGRPSKAPFNLRVPWDV